MNSNDKKEILPLIEHKLEKININQRANDGYVNATALCQAANKRIDNYFRSPNTQEFLEELSNQLKISIKAKIPFPQFEGDPIDSFLIQVIHGGHNDLRGTWVHPQVAINLAQWVSPKFAVSVSQWVFDWMNGGGKESYRFPYHIRRYLINRHKIPHTHFSILDQVTVKLLGCLEAKGYIVPAKLMPDISMGKIFSNWLRKQGYDPDGFDTYEHVFDDGVRPVVSARLYPNELMSAFNLELEKWIKSGKALEYFSSRDTNSIKAIKAVYSELPALEQTE